MNEREVNISDDVDDLVELWPFVDLSCEIPTCLHSLKDGPFTKCLVCDRDLMGGSVRYFVERIFRGTEPIIEYAMCVMCQEAMCAELSKESVQAIHQIFEDVDMMDRCDRLRPFVREAADPVSLLAAFRGELRLDFDVSPWLDNCYVSGKRRVDCGGYQYIAACQGDSLELGAAPIMLSQETMEGVVKVISKSTRERLDDFVGDYFGMPPEYCESPDSFPLLV